MPTEPPPPAVYLQPEDSKRVATAIINALDGLPQRIANSLDLKRAITALEEPLQPNATGFLILFHCTDGVDEWEWSAGDIDNAHAQATSNRRHIDYGRQGYSILPCPLKPPTKH